MKPGPKPGSRMQNLSGLKFGKLTVINFIEKKGTNYFWLCRCDCGTEIVTSACHFKSGHTTCCGNGKCKPYFKHGKTWTPEYQMLVSARWRAKKEKLPFNLELEDIVIPELCPILGIPLQFKNRVHIRGGIGKPVGKSDSPSLDKIFPKLGYVKRNVWVISRRANLIKSDASVEELRKIADAVEKKIEELKNGESI